MNFMSQTLYDFSVNDNANNSVSLGSNTITGTTAQFNTALTDNVFAKLAG